MQREKALNPSRPGAWAWAALACVLLFVVICRLQMLSFPLERDEGEYAYAGQLILQGVPPYSLACNMKLPGTYLMYALIMLVFPQTPEGIHLGLLFLNMASVLLVFLVARRLFDTASAVISAAFFALLSLSPWVYGVQAHATHFIVFFALWGVLLLLKAIDAKKAGTVFLSGALFGLAFIMKQQAAPIVLFGLVYLVLYSRGWKESLRNAGLFSAGAVLPFAAVCLWLFAAGVFQDFWFWTFKYASQYVSEVPVREAVSGLAIETFASAGPYLWVWLLGAVGAFLPVKSRHSCRHPYFTAGLLIATFLSVCPGFYFRPHYFVTMLPVLAISAAVFTASFARDAAGSKLPPAVKKLPFIAAAAGIVLTLCTHYTFFFLPPQEACRKIYQVNPFPEAIKVAEYIRANTRPGDTVAVLGSEPEIYFYSGRRSATGFIYTYSLVEKGNIYAPVMQRRFAGEVMNARPAYIVSVHGANSWAAPDDAVREALRWSKPFLGKHYRLAGTVEIFYGRDTRYSLGSGEEYAKPASRNYMRIYRRAGYKGPADL